MSMNWKSYKGSRILYIDYSGMDDATMIEQMENYYKEVANETIVRQLSNFTGVIIPKAFMSRAKQLSAEYFSTKNVKIAVIGISKYQTAYLSTFTVLGKAKTVGFSTEEEAMKWLIKD